MCAALASQAEREEGIPPGLVHAVALAESGRWLADERTTRPWPWTVTSGADSFFLAVQARGAAQGAGAAHRGRTNIDVGCMQINLGYHGHAFASVAEALEPATNVAYGAQFLRRLREETRSWARATARYHSAHPERGQAYREQSVSLLAPGAPRPGRSRTRRSGLRADRSAGAASRPTPARLIVPGRPRADARRRRRDPASCAAGAAAPRDG